MVIRHKSNKSQGEFNKNKINHVLSYDGLQLQNLQSDEHQKDSQPIIFTYDNPADESSKRIIYTPEQSNFYNFYKSEDQETNQTRYTNPQLSNTGSGFSYFQYKKKQHKE